MIPLWLQACSLALRVRLRLLSVMSLAGTHGRCWVGFTAPPYVLLLLLLLLLPLTSAAAWWLEVQMRRWVADKHSGLESQCGLVCG